ncbi:HAD-IA family hydrolase [Algivirga pacifica]|uniref:HAD family hydrolase n=1 Tax=Algivirga pacifica TaxID=1162670 RepID=A0ABP9DMQ3_9BACT
MNINFMISDCDGVIIDSEIIAAGVMVDYLKAQGAHIDMQEYLRTWSGTTFTGIMKHFRENEGVHIPTNFLEDIEERLLIRNAKELKGIRGVKEAYESIPLPKACVSNSISSHVRKAIEMVNLKDSFQDRVYSAVELVENPKPAPDIYLHAAQKEKVTPSEVVVIEDSRSGVNAAVAAGMTVIGFTGASHILDGYGETLKNLGAHYVINDMSELPALVEQIGIFV